MGWSHTRTFLMGFSAVLGGFGVGYAALAAVPASAPQMTSVSSPVSWTAPAPTRDAQPPVAAPRAPTAERTAPAPTRTAEAPPADAPAKSKSGPIRIEFKDSGVSASLDPDTRKVRVRTPFGNYDFGM